MHKKSPILDNLSYVVGYAISIAFIIAVIVLIYQFSIKGYSIGVEMTASPENTGPPKDITLTIEKDASVLEVGKILESNELIGNAYIYTLEALLSGSNLPFPGGTYTISTDMDKNAITRRLRNLDEESSEIVITINEGWSLKDIAEYLESKDIVTAEEFIEAANSGTFDYDFLSGVPDRENRIEGYLFPDTYRISANSTPNQVINRMLSRFDDIYDDEFRKRTEILGLTIDEVVTMASIVEKEIKVPEERGLASAVIYNRLDIGMKLEMCSTVLYVLDKKKAWLLYSDLEIESPYNTYMYPGLPIGPISNPGAACIRAVLYPADVNYLYFVVKDEELGEHFFTDDFQSFLNAKDEYKQRF